MDPQGEPAKSWAIISQALTAAESVLSKTDAAFAARRLADMVKRLDLAQNLTARQARRIQELEKRPTLHVTSVEECQHQGLIAWLRARPALLWEAIIGLIALAIVTAGITAIVVMSDPDPAAVGGVHAPVRADPAVPAVPTVGGSLTRIDRQIAMPNRAATPTPSTMQPSASDLPTRAATRTPRPSEPPAQPKPGPTATPTTQPSNVPRPSTETRPEPRTTPTVVNADCGALNIRLGTLLQACLG